MTDKQALGLETLQLVFDNMQAMVYVTDVDTYEIIFANKFLKSGYDYEIEGKPCWQALSSFPGPCPYCKLGDLLEKPVGEPVIWENYNFDMNMWLKMNDSLVNWPDGRPVHLITITDITDVKKNEESLKLYKDDLESLLAEKTESERVLRTLSDNLPGGFVFQIRGPRDRFLPTITHLSKGFETVCRLDVAETKSHPMRFFELFDPEVLKTIQTHVFNGTSFSLETPINIPDSKEPVWLLFSFLMSQDTNGEAVMDGFALDISARKANEQALHVYRETLEALLVEKTEGEERLKSLSDNLPASFVFQLKEDESGHISIAYMSAGVEAICGISPEKLGEDMSPLAAQFFPEDFALVQQKASQGTMFSVEVRLQVPHREGIVWLLFSEIPRKLPSGEILWDGIAMDVTERKQMEEELKSSQEELLHRAKQMNQIAENMVSSALYRTHIDAEGVIYLDYASGQVEQITGVSLPEIKADLRAFFRYIHPDDKEAFLKRISSTTAATEEESTEFRYVLDGNIKWYRLISKGTEQDGIVYRDGIMVDITAQKHLELQLIAARDQARESERLKSSFLANMSHEIRTPMNAIIGFLGVLSEDEEIDRETQLEYMRIVSDNANQLLKLIGDILDISKINAGQMKIAPIPSNVNVLLHDIRSSFIASGAITPGKQLELIVDESGQDPGGEFTIDAARLRQIVTNLVGNAIKFTDTGHVKFGYRVLPEGLEFYVEDTGIGISKEKLENLGKPFHQLHDARESAKYGGTGIGLAISTNLVKLMGGRFDVESCLGKGTRFTFTVPCPEIEGSMPPVSQPAEQ